MHKSSLYGCRRCSCSCRFVRNNVIKAMSATRIFFPAVSTTESVQSERIAGKLCAALDRRESCRQHCRSHQNYCGFLSDHEGWSYRTVGVSEYRALELTPCKHVVARVWRRDRVPVGDACRSSVPIGSHAIHAGSILIFLDDLFRLSLTMLYFISIFCYWRSHCCWNAWPWWNAIRFTVTEKNEGNRKKSSISQSYSSDCHRGRHYKNRFRSEQCLLRGWLAADEELE